jgi:hypothetical protein
MKPRIAFDLIGLIHEIFLIVADMDTANHLQ